MGCVVEDFDTEDRDSLIFETLATQPFSTLRHDLKTESTSQMINYCNTSSEICMAT
jgi:hypothetical protein